MRRIFLGLVLPLALALGGVATLGQQTEPAQPMNVWMKRKLDASQKVLEGLALEDYAQIRRSAESMQKMSALEGFVRRTDTAEYRMQLRAFRYANRRLIRAADEKNLDGAALAFTQLTFSCVNCHKHLRTGEGDAEPETVEAGTK